MSGDEFLTTEETVIAAFRSALPTVSVIGPVCRMPKGFGNESWRFMTNAGEMLVKIRRQTTDAAKLRSQVEATRLACPRLRSYMWGCRQPCMNGR